MLVVLSVTVVLREGGKVYVSSNADAVMEVEVDFVKKIREGDSDKERVIVDDGRGLTVSTNDLEMLGNIVCVMFIENVCDMLSSKVEVSNILEKVRVRRAERLIVRDGTILMLPVWEWEELEVVDISNLKDKDLVRDNEALCVCGTE